MTAAELETQPETDFALAQKAAQGDMAAFEQLYQRHNRRVYSLCLRMTSNVSEAEDLAQEVFIQLFRKIGSFRGESAFTPWLHRLTVMGQVVAGSVDEDCIDRTGTPSSRSFGQRTTAAELLTINSSPLMK